MSFLRKVGLLAWKDLRAEFRTKEMISAMLIFALLVIVIFAFAFDPSRDEVRSIFGGLIWVAFFFAGILGLNRSFANERLNDALHGLMLSPVDHSAIYFGKLLGTWAFMTIVEVIALPVFIVIYNYAPSGSWLLAIAVILLATLGFVAIGTFLAALTANTKASEVLLPVILFPIIIPVVIGAVEATRGVFGGLPLDDFVTWFKVLAVYDAIFIAVPFLLFEYLLEV